MQSSAPPRWARHLARFVHRRAVAIVLIATLLYGLAAVVASGLTLDQELRRLLPAHAPSVLRLERLAEVAGQQSDLYVTVRSPSRSANIMFGERLAAELRGRDEFRHVVFRRDLSFFRRHALLYASLSELLDLRRRLILKRRAAVRSQLLHGVGVTPTVDGSPGGTEPDLVFDPDEVRARYGLAEALSEFMETDGGTLMVLKLRPRRPATDLAYAAQVTEMVDHLISKLDPTSFHPKLAVELNGAYIQHQQRVASARREAWGGSVVAGLAILLVVAMYFRSVRAVGLIVAPLLGSVAGALAFARLAFGVLNIVSAFIFAVLLGLGIDFAIHVLSRLREERAAGWSSEAALAVCLGTTGKATAFGAASTALAFAALTIADFQGFAQFGQIAAVGVVLALAGACIVMPALAITLEGRSSVVRPPDPVGPVGPVGRNGASGAARLAVVALALAAAGWGAARLGTLRFESDLRKLGRPPAADGAAPAATYRDAVGTYQTVDPAVALASNAAQAEALQRQFDALLGMSDEELAAFDPERPPSRGGPEPSSPGGAAAASEAPGAGFDVDELADPDFVALEQLARDEAVMSRETAKDLGRYAPQRRVRMRERVARVWSVHAFVPRHQAEKLKVIADLRDRVDKSGGWSDAATAGQVERWRDTLDVTAPVVMQRLPGWARAQFEDADGVAGTFVVISTRGSKADVENAREIYRLLGDLTVAGERVEVAADFFVIPEIFDAIKRDGPRVLGVTAVVFALCALALLRRLGAAAAVVLSVALPLFWLAAVFSALDWRLNFFNIIVLPLLIGMAQDDALHVAQRHTEHARSERPTPRAGQGAILVTTLTTAIGFAALLAADHAGLNSMAWTAVVGMSFAVVASVAVLPLLLARLDRGSKG